MNCKLSHTIPLNRNHNFYSFKSKVIIISYYFITARNEIKTHRTSLSTRTEGSVILVSWALIQI